MNFVFKWLLNHFLFAGTLFFAAGASALGEGGADVGNAGADSLDSGSEQPGDAGAPGTDGAVLDGDTSVQDATGVKPSTHRAVLENFTKSEEFKALQQAKPEVAKAITRLQQSLRTVSEALAPLGGLKNAQEIAKVLSNAGGIEALTDMQARLTEMDAIDAKLASGDPSYITDIAQNMPEEFAAMMPHALDKWAELKPEAFGQFVAQHVVGSLFSDDPDAPGMANIISRAFDLVGQNKGEDAQKLLKQVYAWAKEVRKQAFTKPKVEAKPNANPKANDAAAQREAQNFDRLTGVQVESYSAPKMEAEIRRQFGTRTIEKETMDDMLDAVKREMISRARGDKDFQRQIQQARGKRDEKRVVELAKAFADKNISEVAKLVYGRRYRGFNTQKPAPKAPQNPAFKADSKVISVVTRPKDSELVLNSNQLSAEQRKLMSARGFKTLQQAIMSNIGFTKSGKVVQWQKD